MQGFVILSLLFVLVGVGFGWGASEAMSLPRKLAIFFFFYMTFFFANCGPGSTVYILPSLVFPEKKLSLCHGICACLGKFGGALGSSLYVPLIQAVGMTRVGDFCVFACAHILGHAFFFGCGESGCFLYSFCLHCLLNNYSRRRKRNRAAVCEREGNAALLSEPAQAHSLPHTAAPSFRCENINDFECLEPNKAEFLFMLLYTWHLLGARNDPTRIDLATEHALKSELRSDLSHASTSGNGSGGNVGQNHDIGHLQQRIVRLHGLGISHIQTSSSDDSLLERLGQILLVDHGTTGSVDEDGVLLHLLELLHVEHLAGVLVQSRVDRDEIRASQKILHGHVLNSVLILPVGLAAHIAVDDVASEAAHSLHHLQTNLSHTADTQSLAPDISSAVAKRLPGSPTVVTDGVDGRAQTTGRGQQKRNSQLGDSVVEDTGGVTGEDASLLALGNIDVVVTDRHGGHSLQLRSSGIEELRIDLLSKHAQASIAALDHLQKLVTRNSLIGIVPVNQLDGSVSEHLHGRGGNLSGDKNLPLKLKSDSHLGLGSRSESANESTSLHVS